MSSCISMGLTTENDFPGVTYPKNSNKADGFFSQLYAKSTINDVNFDVKLEDVANTGAPSLYYNEKNIKSP